MGALSRRKGAAFERAVVALLKRVFPQAHRQAPMQAGWPGYPDIGGIPGIHIECGHGARMNAADKWNQADLSRRVTLTEAGEFVTNMDSLTTPVAITKRNRGPILVTLALEDWLAMVEAGKKGEG